MDYTILAIILLIAFLPFSVITIIVISIFAFMSEHLLISTLLLVLFLGWLKYDQVREYSKYMRPAIIITVYFLVNLLPLYISIFFVMIPSVLGKTGRDGIEVIVKFIFYWLFIGMPILVNGQCKFEAVVYKILKYRSQNKRDLLIWIICLTLNIISTLYMIFKVVPGVGYSAFKITYMVANLFNKI